jgi:hypothetical protein
MSIDAEYANPPKFPSAAQIRAISAMGGILTFLQPCHWASSRHGAVAVRHEPAEFAIAGMLCCIRGHCDSGPPSLVLSPGK